ncbi:MAG: C1 family peptidase [Fibromonadaceae bacterium]|jgi:hypothetical protein|nr:C1 family peptidase [Fibromonadaceae bacterium]
MFKRTFISFFFLSAMFLSSCGNHVFDDLNNLLNCPDIDCILNEIISKTGWLAENENLDSIPVVVDDGDTTNLPPHKDLESIFPPIGDQGQYGTCVAWATGYNLKTSLNAIDKNWSAADLRKSENQTSPKDLWFTIPNSDKGSNCGGTNFEPALDALISKGAASMSSVPYTSMGNCSGTSSGNSSNKLGNYRKIAANTTLAGGNDKAGMTQGNFKSHLAQGRPVLFGAKLGDRFMRWSSASPISSDTYNNPGMQHAYHAMIVVGYDDSKRAFRVRNSWADDWGDKGSIWVDYDFFLSKFCFTAFVAENSNSSARAKQLSSNELQITSVKDSVPDKNSPRERVFSYNMQNSGNVTYMYYNAFNANENGIIYEGTAKQQSVRYTMPKITGQYYLVVYAEPNSFYFLATDNGRPLRFVDGVMQNDIVSTPNSKAISVQELGGKPNAYNPEEIKSLILRNRKK